MTPAPRRGWCPGVARPMPTGDGLLVRVHPPAGLLTAAQARAVAEGARENGNGLIDVTARGNLQVRGVRPETHEALATRIAAAGLGDRRGDGGPQRLTLSSPLAGLDPGLAWLIEAVEAAGRAVAGLPAKTLVAVEGDACGLGPVEADIWIRRIGGMRGIPSPVRERGRGEGPGPFRHESLSVVLAAGRFSLPAEPPGPSPLPLSRTGEGFPAAGSEMFALAVAGAEGPVWAEPVAAERVEPAVTAILTGFARTGARRVRELDPAARCGLLAAADLDSGGSPPAAAQPPAPGLRPLGDGRVALVAELPFGRCDAARLVRLAEAGARNGDGLLRLTPWRGVMMVAADEAGAARLWDAAQESSLIVGPADPRRAVAACPGAPACASGGTPAQAHAARLAAERADLARLGLTVHVSGCPKGCAHPAPADLTLVGRPDGRYGVVRGGHAGADTRLTLTFEAVLERLNSPVTATDLIDAFREPA
ncbi:nitrite reductase [Methylobacterium nodulans]|uniref:Nitrite/sulfite reductase hemoprotein beta-component ferrodoxin domain protein n=1 Tax=Methylobacterium nodulans (strain LMG 21967 / CNCM I-2342 / ORS 2060) TaxID=460265 RepID=B8IUR5_METNO|nr:nitrite reductase [Methylobacterium nodulans]ACL57133.1 nitrite/sulfite reductase hemoprotein beta-component ferrodoxin domain protein [Methylobacterium nodulans ORS 2060]